MELDTRTRAVLQIVVDIYIDDAQPVSSAAVTRRGAALKLSSATIRSIMADLEEEGLLSQPHTSAGRVPTELGLRAYLDSLMSPKLHPWDRSRLDLAVANTDPVDFPLILGQSLAGLSGQVAVVAVPRFIGSRLREIGIIRIHVGRFVAYFVSPGGLVQQKLVEVDFDLTDDEVQRAQNFLNEQLYDHEVNETHELVRNELALAEAECDFLRVHALEICRQALPGNDMKVHVEGATHLVDQPEFADVHKLRSVLRAFDDKAALFRLLDRVLDGQGVQVVLGAREVPELACVGTAIPAQSVSAGAITLMGPWRMDYGRLVPMVSYALQLFTGYCRGI